MAEVKRYEPALDFSKGEACLREHEEGPAVMHADHTSVVAALERRLRIAERALKSARDYANSLRLEFVSEKPDDSVEEYLADAEREIDSEQKELLK